jgi:hypothetical protein
MPVHKDCPGPVRARPVRLDHKAQRVRRGHKVSRDWQDCAEQQVLRAAPVHKATWDIQAVPAQPVHKA